VIRTRVGYAGGTTEDPTYYDLGDHSETIQIDYDPDQISYQELLDLFWSSHSPTSRPWSNQYASIIFYHDEEQKQLAEASLDRLAAEADGQIFTQIVPFSEFYLAEAYHQKYRLQQAPRLLEEFRTIYPDEEDFINSTAAARLNGYAGGYGTPATLEAEIGELGLTPEQQERLLEIVLAPKR
jgi:peptide-methionine (S)-S-oxide reductase